MRPAPFLVFLSLFAAGTAMAAPQAAPAPRHPARPADPAAPRPSEVVSEDQLFARLAKAESREDAKPIEEKLEAMFRASGSPSVDLLMNRAEVAAAADDKAMARKLLESVTTIAPKFAEGWHARAALETASGDDTSALISLQKVVLLNPRQFNALNELAGMLEDYGDKAGALKLYRRALALDPQLEGVEHHLRALTRQVEGQDI
jgi:tetratricopeptide (TPR) repeat protein